MLRVALLLVVLISVAHAQPPAAPPAPAAPVANKRWSVGFYVGPEVLVPHTTNTRPLAFGQLEFPVRYRIRPNIEIAGAFHAGNAKHADGDIGMAGLLAEIRYRFFPEQRWNAYAAFGLGALAVAHRDAPDVEKEGRGMLRLGAGIERRWHWFALCLELRMFAIAKNEDVPTLDPPNVGYQFARHGLSGYSIGFGPSFYF